MNSIIFALTALKTPTSEGSNGGSISNYYLVKHLSKNANVSVICPSCNFSIENDLSKVKLEVIKQLSTRGFIKRLTFQVKVLYRLFILCFKAYLKGKKLTLVSNTVTIPCVYFISKLFNFKHIVLCRAYEEFFFGAYNPISYSPLYIKIRRFVNLGLTKKAYENSLLITNSIWMISALKKSFEVKGKIELLYPPVNFSHSSKGKKSSSIKTVGFINSGTFKGHSIILSLASSLPDLTFHIYGDNKIFIDAKTSLPSNVFLFGWQTSEVIYKSIDILLIPSSWPEPFGRVSIEAQNMILPVLVSNSGGLPETVISKDFIVKDSSVEEWKKSLSLILGNYESYLSEIREKKMFLKKFDFTAHNKKLDNIFFD